MTPAPASPRRRRTATATAVLATAVVGALGTAAGASTAHAAPAAPATPAAPAIAALSPSVAPVAGLSTAGSHQVLLLLASREGSAGVQAIAQLAKTPLPTDSSARAAALVDRRAALAAASPAADSLDRVRAFAAAAGLTVYSATSTTVTLDGTPSALASAFGTTLTPISYADGQGHTLAGIGHTAPLAVPVQIAPVVTGVVGLDDTTVTPHHDLQRATPAAPPNDPAPYNDPRDVYSSAYNGHYGNFKYPNADGHGVTVAITAEGGEAVSLATYNASLAAAQITGNPTPVDAGYDPADPSPLGGNAGDGELMIDMVAVAGVAPKAQQRIYAYGDSSGRVTPTQVLAYYAKLADDATANLFQVATESYGFCEEDAFVQLLTNPAANGYTGASVPASLARLTAAGATYFASSGDDGGFCKNHTTPSINYPTADPSVVSVGGVSWPDTSNSGADDYAWGRTFTNPVTGATIANGTGGGFSTIFPRPAYQPVGVGNFRAVPDVAGPADVYAGGEYVMFPDANNGGVVDQQPFGGTSLASPLWAGWLADVLSVPVTGSYTVQGLGDIHAALYAGETATFNDVTTGTDFVTNAGPGYDAVTGLGTPKLQVLADTLLTPSTTPALTVPAFTASTTVPVTTNIATDKHFRASRVVAGTDTCTTPPAAGALPATAVIPAGDGQKALTLTTVDLLGTCRVSAPAFTTLDTTAPTIAATVVSVSNKTQAVATISVADAGSGIKTFSAQIVNRDSGAVVMTVTQNGGPYLFPAEGGHFIVTATAVDAVGNAAPAFTSATYAAQAVDDKTLTHSKGWFQYTNRAGRLNGTLSGSRTPGATLTYKNYTVNSSYGVQHVNLHSGGGGGTVKVFIDGKKVAVMKLSKPGSFRAVFNQPGGKHTITLQVASGFVVIDGVQVW